MSDNRELYVLDPVVQGTTGDEVTIELKVNGVAVNLTSAAIKIAFVKHGSKKPIVTFSVGSGITVTNAIGGIFKINSGIYNWRTGVYFADVDITLSDGTKLNYLKLKIEITENKGKDA